MESIEIICGMMFFGYILPSAIFFAIRFTMQWKRRQEGKNTKRFDPNRLATGKNIHTKISVINMNREQMEACGYEVAYQSEDGKYLIMGNGTKAFAIPTDHPDGQIDPLLICCGLLRK